MKRDVPEPWAAAMLKAGMVDGRYGHPSWSALARKVGVHASTITAMADGLRRTDVETITKVAEVLRVDAGLIGEWIGETRSIGALYDPPAESRFLSDEEKKALTLLIKSIADGKVGSGHVESPAKKTDDGAEVVELRPPGTNKRAARNRTQRKGMPEPDSEK